MRVVVKNNDLQAAIRVLRNKIAKSGLSQDLALHKIGKPSERKKEKARRAERRKKEAQRRRMRYQKGRPE